MIHVSRLVTIPHFFPGIGEHAIQLIVELLEAPSVIFRVRRLSYQICVLANLHDLSVFRLQDPIAIEIDDTKFIANQDFGLAVLESADEFLLDCDDDLPGLVNNAILSAFDDDGATFEETVRPIKLRLNDRLSALIDVTAHRRFDIAGRYQSVVGLARLVLLVSGPVRFVFAPRKMCVSERKGTNCKCEY